MYERTNEQQEIHSLLLETKSALRQNTSWKITQVQTLHYEQQIVKCTLDQHQNIVNSLYYQIQAANNDYASLMMEYSYIQEIQSLLVNNTFDIEINQLSFDVIINETTTPSSFPLKIAFNSQVMDYIYELTVVVDHNTPLTVINRDIAEAI